MTVFLACATVRMATLTPQEPKSNNECATQSNKNELDPLSESSFKLVLDDLCAADVDEGARTDRQQNWPNNRVLFA